ncbi:MAG TPA: mandelate racemase/muconate lactonizing enzyme family protein [Bryobacteraceae bacterium]|nr:mandelate racemase/muconate lactonizing enzyme family protein [Bryobacteraceae bacterium]
MKITSIEKIPVRVPIRKEFQIRGSLGMHVESPFLILKVHTDEGITGIGEVSCTPVWSGEDSTTAAHIIGGFLEPALIGEDPRDIERLTVKMRRAVANHPFTKSGLEIALWDILGKAAGLPVYRLLGGAVREAVTIKMSVSGAEPARAAQLAEWAVAKGLTALKVKVGIEPEGDVERVKAVRAAVGPGFRVGVDANGGWSTRVAIQTIRRLKDECNIYFAEQPVAPLDLQWLVDVRRNVPVPVMADESCYTLQDAMAIARAGAADILSIYVGKGGGIGPARKMAAVAEAAGLTCTVGSNLELGVACAAMAHLATASSGIGAEEFPCDILGTLAYEHDLLAETLEFRDGKVRAPDKPGLGVTLDEAALVHYRG